MLINNFYIYINIFIYNIKLERGFLYLKKDVSKKNCFLFLTVFWHHPLALLIHPPSPILPIFTSNLAPVLMQRDMFCMQISLISQIYPLAPCPLAPCSLLLPAPSCSLLPPAPCSLPPAPCSLPPAPYKSDVWKFVSLYFFSLTFFHALRQHFLGR